MATIKPTSSTGAATAGGLREYSHLTREYVVDRPQVPLFQLPSLSDNTPADLKSVGTGTAVLAELNSSEICGLTFDADNESYGLLWLLPFDIDVASQIDFRYLWSNSEAAATGSCKFITLYKVLPLVGGSTALAVAATALGTAHANQVDLAAEIPQWSPWGTIAENTAGVSTLEAAQDALALKVYVDITTVANASMFAGQVRYYRKYI